MRELHFKLTLKSDIVLQKNANTQGKNESLDSISGAVILGIVAQSYDSFSNPYCIFHSGDVRFGEAKPLIDNQISYKMPLSFFKPKDSTDFNDIYNMAFWDFDSLLEKQLKVIPNGYITQKDSSLLFANPTSYYIQKVNLQTKDNDIFGYEVLQRGGIYSFCVSFSENISVEVERKIADILQGTHYIGKSKTAEFGKIEICQISQSPQKTKEVEIDEFDMLYVNSHLALFHNAMPTIDFNALNCGENPLEIIYEKTFIKTSSYMPYNTKRKSKDSIRLLIEKGSVISVKKLDSTQRDNIKKGIGAFQSCGFGEILINPSFLSERRFYPFSLHKHKIDRIATDNATIKNIEIDKNLITYLKNLKDKKEQQVTLANKIDIFIEQNKDDFKQIPPAQWGAIRAFTHIISEKDLCTHIRQFIEYANRKDKWENINAIFMDFINENNTKEAIALLAMRIQHLKAEQ